MGFGRGGVSTVAVAVGILVTTWVLAVREAPLPGEGWLFEAINGWSGSLVLRVPLVVVMQFGAIGAAPVTAVTVAMVAAAAGTTGLARSPSVARGSWRRPWQGRWPWCWTPATWLVAAAVAGAALAAHSLANLAKRLHERPRPDSAVVRLIERESPEGLGYPSGHAAVSAAMAVIAWYALPGRWRWLPVAIAVLVSVARIYVGVHYPLDVLGGAALGVLVGVGIRYAARAVHSRISGG